MKKIFLVYAMLFLCLSIGLCSATTVSLRPIYSTIYNPSFETWTGNVPDGWAEEQSGQSSTTDHAIGSKAYLITGDGTSNPGWCQQVVNIDPDQYILGGYLKVDGATAGGASVSLMNDTDWTWFGGIYNYDSGYGWKYQETTVDITEPNPKLRVMAVDDPTIGATYEIDGVFLSRVYNNISATETVTQSTATQSFSFAPGSYSNNAYLITSFQSLDMNWHTINSVSCTIDGYANTVYLAPDGKVYIDTSEMTDNMHDFVITANISTDSYPKNTGFENWDSSTEPTDWIKSSRTNEMYDIAKGTEANSGSFSLQINGNSSNPVTGHIVQTIPSSNQYSHVSIYAKSTGVTSGNPQIMFYNGQEHYFDLPSMSMGWQRFDFYFTPSNVPTSGNEIDIYLAGDSNTGSTWYLDDLVLDNATAPPNTLMFSGYNFTIRQGNNYPGNQIWNLTGPYVDGTGHLHLTMGQHSGTWWGSETDSKFNFSYGVYTWVVEPGSLSIDKNMTFGLFTYHNDTNEIDIESGQWQNSSNPRLWYTSQPGIDGVTSKGFSASDTGSNIVYTFDWEKNYIHWRSYYQNTGNVIADWNFTDSSKIPHVASPICFNIWQYHPPANGQNVDIVIDSFTYQPTDLSLMYRDPDVTYYVTNGVPYTFHTVYSQISTVHYVFNGVDTTTEDGYVNLTITKAGYNPVSVYATDLNGNTTDPITYNVFVSRSMSNGAAINNSKLPVFDYAKVEDDIINFNGSGIASDIQLPFENTLGKTGICVLIALPFLFVWINTKEITMPGVLFMLFGWLLVGWIPAQYQYVIWGFIVFVYAMPFFKIIYPGE